MARDPYAPPRPTNSKGIGFLYGADPAPPPPPPVGVQGSGLAGLLNTTASPPPMNTVTGYGLIYPQAAPPLPISATSPDDPSVGDFLSQLIQGLNVSAPQVPQPQAPDYAALLAPYAQARDAANASAVAGRGVIGDAQTQAMNQIGALRDQYAAMQSKLVADQQAHAQAAQAGLSQSLSPLSSALAAQGADAGPLNQQAAALQGVLQAGAASAQQLADQRNIQATNDFGGRQQDTAMIKEAALGTLQNNLDAALQKIGIGESQARNAYSQQYEAAKRQAAQQQWAMEQQAAQENRATGRQMQQFLLSLRQNNRDSTDGPAMAASMVDDYAKHSPTGYNSRAIQAFNSIVNGDDSVSKPKSKAEALSRIPQYAKDLRLNPDVLTSWVNTYYQPKSASGNLPDDWRDQLAQYAAVLNGGI